jgi:HTH-type transcriptional regulator / antitoxin HigA
MEAVIGRQAAKVLAGHFRAISKHVPLRPIRSEADYDAAVASLNGLLDAGAADEKHPLADLAATLGELIGDYDDAHYPAKDVAPSEMLRFLMDQHGLKQTDLAQELGSQGVVSEVLHGKRELNLRQMRALAGRFGVPVAAFVDGMHAPVV